MGRKADNLIGFRFGYLEVIKKSDYKDACRCALCGTIKDIRGDNLWSGRSTTCGCNRKKGFLSRHNSENKAF
jgi:hypothetical protein